MITFVQVRQIEVLAASLTTHGTIAGVVDALKQLCKPVEELATVLADVDVSEISSGALKTLITATVIPMVKRHNLQQAQRVDDHIDRVIEQEKDQNHEFDGLID